MGWTFWPSMLLSAQGFHGEGGFRVVSVFDLIFIGQTPGRTSSGVVCCEAHVSHGVGEVSSVK